MVRVRKDVGVAAKRALGQHTDVALRRGVRSCYAEIAKEANCSRNGAFLDAARPTILGGVGQTAQKRAVHVDGFQEVQVSEQY